MSFQEYENTKPALIIKATLDLLHEPGTVFEVRIPKTKSGTISGYFNDNTIAASLIAKENSRHQSIYMTVNPVNPDLLSRSANVLNHSTFLTTSDKDILRRRWFLMDFDPVRPVGISSSDVELEAARAKSIEVTEWLSSIGWPDPIRANSGNGVHVMYRTDDPNDENTRGNYECALKMLASLFSDTMVKVDVTVSNASRIWKIYGTVSAKGSSTPERPHRVAMITAIPSEMVLVTLDQINNVARPLLEAKSDEYRDATGEYITDMSKWLTDRQLTIASGPRPMFGNEGQKWIISTCPFNPDHQNPMVGLVNNRPVFRCLHDSCSAHKWKEFREKVDPNYKHPDTILERLKIWAGSEEQTMDGELVQSACATGKALGGILKKLKLECPRPRMLLLEDLIKQERARFRAATIGDNNDKYNIVGLINRTKEMQKDGSIPMYWVADYDHRVRVGRIGDINAPKCSAFEELRLMVKFHSQGDAWVKQTQASQVINYIAAEYTINPLRLHLRGLVWDGIDRLDDWLVTYLGTKDTVYTRAVGRKWLISAVARGMEPGCQVDHMLILEGTQGIGKSQSLRALGGQFYCEYSGGITGGGTVHKDMVAVIAGKMIVELGELASIKKSEIEQLKVILTTVADDVRLSYERDPMTYPRTCVFSGTTNEVGMAYIPDQSGMRRFWPVHVGEIKKVRADLLREIRDQLWAEAVIAYDKGEDWHTVPEEEVQEEQRDRQMSVESTDPWYARIRNALTDPDSYSNEIFTILPERAVVRAGRLDLILSTVLQIDIARQCAADVMRVSRIFRVIGFKKVTPAKKWRGSNYAYDLKSTDIPNLWVAINEASKIVKFPRQSEEET